MIELSWHGCYEDSWRGYITDEAFQHPAKFAKGLIRRIFDYMLVSGMIRRGDSVVDPFGGIGSGGIVAAGLGLRWFGCELEPKFHALGQQNFALHRHVWENLGDPLPVLVNGDSRKLRENFAGVLADCVACSPPFVEQQQVDDRENPASAMSSTWRKRQGDITAGSTEGQLATLPAGNVSAVVSSPPYAESLKGDNTEQETAAESQAKRVTPGGSLGQSCRHSGYGGAGNLGNLEAGTVDAVATSPPYLETGVANANGGQQIDPALLAESLRRKANGQKGVDLRKTAQGDATKVTEGQLGQATGETFWHAARDIVRECHAILKPGGWSTWVVKDFIRNKARVSFCDDWCKLLESCGFVVTHRARAWLVKHKTDRDLFGGDDHVKTTARKSFFRRLYESKYPHNSIDFEEVVFAQKPENA